MSPESWRWVWTALAVVMGIGEIFTAGFFLLPFSVGAVVAAVLAWLGVGVIVQWLVFVAVSVASLLYLRRFVAGQESPPAVGANRWVAARGVVLEAIEPDTARGLVRIDGEEWRATAVTPLAAGTKVVVREVRGTRLVVEASDS